MPPIVYRPDTKPLLSRATSRSSPRIMPPWVCPDSCSATPRAAASAGQDRMIVGQHAHSHAGVMAHPRFVTKEVLVIAGTDPNAVLRMQIAERLHVGAPRGERAVD